MRRCRRPAQKGVETAAKSAAKVNPNFCKHVFKTQAVGEVSVNTCDVCGTREFSIFPMNVAFGVRHVRALHEALIATNIPANPQPVPGKLPPRKKLKRSTK